MSIPLQETKRQLHKGPAICAIRVWLDGCKPASLGVAIERGMVLNLDCTWQNGASHVAHSVIPSFTNSNPKKLCIDRGFLPRNKTEMAFCSRGVVVQMRNELRESPATAYRT